MGFTESDFYAAIAVLVAFGITLGLLLGWLLPLAWAWLKPLLHVLTA